MNKKKINDETINDNEVLFKTQGNYGKEGHMTTGTVEDHFRELNAKIGGEKSRKGIYAKFVIKNLRTLFKSTCQEALQFITFNRNKSNIEKTVYDYFNANYKEDILEKEENLSTGSNKCSILCKLAYELALEDESNFRDDDEYLNSLIQKAIVKYAINPNIILFENETLAHDELELLNKHISLQFDLLDRIKSNNILWDMVKDDQITLKNVMVYVMKMNLDNLDNLTDEDRDNMVQDILMQYLSVD